MGRSACTAGRSRPKRDDATELDRLSLFRAGPATGTVAGSRWTTRCCSPSGAYWGPTAAGHWSPQRCVKTGPAVPTVQPDSRAVLAVGASHTEGATFRPAPGPVGCGVTGRGSPARLMEEAWTQRRPHVSRLPPTLFLKVEAAARRGAQQQGRRRGWGSCLPPIIGIAQPPVGDLSQSNAHSMLLMGLASSL